MLLQVLPDMIEFSIYGLELGIGVGVLAVLWLGITVLVYLLWYRFLHETIKRGNPIVKAATVILLAGFLTLIVLAVFFALVNHKLTATYTFPTELIYGFS
jgi:hypothetical protein